MIGCLRSQWSEISTCCTEQSLGETEVRDGGLVMTGEQVHYLISKLPGILMHIFPPCRPSLESPVSLSSAVVSSPPSPVPMQSHASAAVPVPHPHPAASPASSSSPSFSSPPHMSPTVHHPRPPSYSASLSFIGPPSSTSASSPSAAAAGARSLEQPPPPPACLVEYLAKRYNIPIPCFEPAKTEAIFLQAHPKH